MKSFLVSGVEDLGILVIQFAKVNTYLGKFLFTVLVTPLDDWTTPLFLFINGGLPHSFPKEDCGRFAFNLKGIVKKDFWWYMACKCHRSVNANESGTYYCSSCEGFVTDVTPRYRLKLEVSDVTETAHFVLFYYDVASLLCKSCVSMVGDAKVPSLEYPAELDNLIGKELLFKLEVKDDRAFRFDDSFKVRRICDDEDIIKEFKQEKSVQTPEMLKAPVHGLSDDEVGGGNNEQGSEFVGLAELYNDGEINSPTVRESSSDAACLAPQKRKCVACVGRGSSMKKNGTAKALKIEKD
ncbi:hypothetical protein SESBI_03180 [Sesbania bispinosa]|nr:hypothetical protein SESBI_03180 [Sesbania bispinosa]